MSQKKLFLYDTNKNCFFVRQSELAIFYHISFVTDITFINAVSRDNLKKEYKKREFVMYDRRKYI